MKKGRWDLVKGAKGDTVGIPLRGWKSGLSILAYFVGESLLFGMC